MTSLETRFAGLTLRNPIVMASAPPTESLESIVRCADAGAAAIVTKTLADFPVERFPLGARRAHVDRSGMWALSTFRRETLELSDGLRLVDAAATHVDIPVIASVGALSMSPESWLAPCRAARDAGASAIQLDLFYTPHPRSAPENIDLLAQMLDVVCAGVDIPVIPKLNTELPAHHIAEVLKATPVTAAFAIDSIRAPVPLVPGRGGHELTVHAPNAPEASLFGAWQKPITLQYGRTLAENSNLDLCIGGGLMTGYDAAEAILLGAEAIGIATAVIRHGFRRINTILDQLTGFMSDNGYGTIDNFRGAALPTFASSEEDIEFVDVKAEVDHEVCTMCGMCTTLVFCPDITIADGQVNILDHCDGCGLCVSLCPTKPKALRLVPHEVSGLA